MNGANSFSPNPASVQVGQQIRWRNDDTTTHTATQNGGGFDTGLIPPGETSAPITLSADEMRATKHAGAEWAVYTTPLRGDLSDMRAGRHGWLKWTLPGDEARTVGVDSELRANAVWRFGRVFLRCPRCSRPATRLYVPTENTEAACRRCWGLTYESRQERSYRPSRAMARFPAPNVCTHPGG